MGVLPPSKPWMTMLVLKTTVLLYVDFEQPPYFVGKNDLCSWRSCAPSSQPCSGRHVPLTLSARLTLHDTYRKQWCLTTLKIWISCNFFLWVYDFRRISSLVIYTYIYIFEIWQTLVNRTNWYISAISHYFETQGFNRETASGLLSDISTAWNFHAHLVFLLDIFTFLFVAWHKFGDLEH